MEHFTTATNLVYKNSLFLSSILLIDFALYYMEIVLACRNPPTLLPFLISQTL